MKVPGWIESARAGGGLGLVTRWGAWLREENLCFKVLENPEKACSISAGFGSFLLLEADRAERGCGSSRIAGAFLPASCLRVSAGLRVLPLRPCSENSSEPSGILPRLQGGVSSPPAPGTRRQTRRNVTASGPMEPLLFQPGPGGRAGAAAGMREPGSACTLLLRNSRCCVSGLESRCHTCFPEPELPQEQTETRAELG